MRTRLLACWLPVLGLLWFGCGSSTPLDVVATAPEDGASQVPVETAILARLSQNVDPATLNSQTFLVTSPAGGSVTGSVRIGDEPDIVVFEPSEPLDTTTAYTATITTGLMSTSGASPIDLFQWNFTTLDPAWGVSELIDESGASGNSSMARVVADRNGNAYAVWERADGGSINLWASRYTRRDLWSEPEQIETGDGDVVNARVAVDPGGNALVIWEQPGPAPGIVNIWSNRFTVGQGWGTAEIIQNGEVTTARNPAIAVDPDGNAVAIWIQDVLDPLPEGAGALVWANRCERNGTWGNAERIQTQGPTALSTTSIAVDPDGNVTALWVRQRQPGDEIYANRFDSDEEEWGIEVEIKGEFETNIEGQRLAAASDGDVHVVWTQVEEMDGGGELRSVWTALYNATSNTWGAAAAIETHETGDATEPDIAVGPSGVARAVWSQQDDRFFNVWSSAYSPGLGWGAPELIEPPVLDAFGQPDLDNDDDASKPRIAINHLDVAFVVWEQGSMDWLSIWSNRLEPDAGWVMDDALLIEQIELAGRSPEVTVDQLGHAHVVWLHTNDEGRGEIRTNRFE